MSKITSGRTPTTSSTGSARQAGSARQKTGKQASQTSKTGQVTRVRKPLTPAQRKRKQERDRRYRARKHGKAPATGARSTVQDSPCKTTVPHCGCGCGCGSSADAVSNARKWLTEVWSAVKPGERQSHVFTGDGRHIRVEVLCGQPAARTASVPADVFDGLVAALLQSTIRMLIHCGVDFGCGVSATDCHQVPRELALRWQLHADVRSLVDSRRGWLHAADAGEELA